MRGFGKIRPPPSPNRKWIFRPFRAFCAEFSWPTCFRPFFNILGGKYQKVCPTGGSGSEFKTIYFQKILKLFKTDSNFSFEKKTRGTQQQLFKSSQELRMLFRSLSDCQSLCLCLCLSLTLFTTYHSSAVLNPQFKISLTHSLTGWQGHLLSCPGQLKIGSRGSRGLYYSC